MALSAHKTRPDEADFLPSMGREQTLAFLASHGVSSLGLTSQNFEGFKPESPILYIFEDSLPAAVFGALIENRRPSIARVDHPIELKFGGFLATTGQIDYYAIDPKTKKIFRVRSGGKSKIYEVGIPYLYNPYDELFPKGPPLSQNL